MPNLYVIMKNGSVLLPLRYKVTFGRKYLAGMMNRNFRCGLLDHPVLRAMFQYINWHAQSQIRAGMLLFDLTGMTTSSLRSNR